MQLSFHKADLLEAIQIVQSSISNKTTLPILSNFLLQTGSSSQKPGTVLRLEATDLEMGIRTTVKAEILKEGRITVPAKKFGELVREMPEGKEIELISNDGKRIELKCGKVKATLVSLPPEDFPLIPQFPEKQSFKIKKSIFQEMIKKTYFAVSTDETRYVLNGIFFIVQSGELKMVATDGRRLAFISKNSVEQTLNANVIIPSKATNELLRLLSHQSSDQEEDAIHIAPYENQVSFKWVKDGEEIVLVSRVIDGTFPNYDQVIPKNKEIELKVKTSEIFSAIKRAALFAQDRSGSVKLSLKKGVLKISANAQNVGEEEEELDIAYNGNDFDIAFNPAFLLDVLKNSDSPEIHFEFTSSLNPGLIRPEPGGSYLCVIMPMRLQ
ncbi:MAG: DNA polymerase III subunit beta [Elusimicrobia bacterium RIFCSPLOWO2_02_FULL_39_32]|nr:MAG: DNA polymerase III subunit beta [Elusimicrobia bacterium GWA2_38_7]OGR80688.1 MAG: DNA polymerase III subunit beta [Elusimicrobia bacterium RIFCSPHIGHO2_02_FULL_39_36]OGR91536.1 MAG: DNA polymerase III subunit beta [Elusimicrobia bacterium RIFCSPLOWO2_02_FULL_39_32]OGS00791.1 MAG: DNA polymerase III subunit beta [Elusimicrobia bacterium RIFCSPLOWO2_12_FULL_39_28]